MKTIQIFECIQQYSIQVFIETFVGVKFLTQMYADICLSNFFVTTNIQTSVCIKLNITLWNANQCFPSPIAKV